MKKMSTRDIKNTIADTDGRVRALVAQGHSWESAAKIVDGWEYSELLSDK